jgi:CRISPR-associated protein Csm4
LKLFEITIKPKSAFGTVMKGDTLFGQFCWQAAHDGDLIDGGLEKNLAAYDENPFIVFSSAFPKNVVGRNTVYYLPKPEHPVFLGSTVGQDIRSKIETRKEQKKKNWLKLDSSRFQVSPSAKCLSDEEVIREINENRDPDDLKDAVESGVATLRFEVSQAHNSINRLTQTTGKDEFAPYSSENFFFYPGMELAVFIVLDDRITTIDRVLNGLNRIGQTGFGRDASTGLGRFEACEPDEIVIDEKDADACYTLAPCVPGKGRFDQLFFKPFIRYGKHGDLLARSENPFKRPVIMADEGAVFIPVQKTMFASPWIGSSVRNVSFLKPETVCQGYAPWFPLKLEEHK